MGNSRILLGDDLGADKYIHALARLDFTNVPYLKKYNIRPFIFGEYVYYPPHSVQNIDTTTIKESLK